MATNLENASNARVGATEELFASNSTSVKEKRGDEPHEARTASFTHQEELVNQQIHEGGSRGPTRPADSPALSAEQGEPGN